MPIEKILTRKGFKGKQSLTIEQTLLIKFDFNKI